MRLGPLRYRVEIQENQETRNATNGITRTWVHLKTVYASITPVLAREFEQSNQVKADVTHNIRIRYFEGLTPKMRFKHGEKFYNITGILADGKTGQAFQTVDVKEVV